MMIGPIKLWLEILASFFAATFLATVDLHAQTTDQRQSQSQTRPARGIDFRVQITKGSLDFTSISGLKRSYTGIGSELATHVYILDSGAFRSTVFMSSRVMSYTGQNLAAGEADDLQIFTLAPGAEIDLGPLYVQAAYQMMNVNSYVISATSLYKRYTATGPSFSGGINFRLGHLGVGFGVTSINIPVSGDKLGLPTDSVHSELSYSVNFVYYMGVPLGRFVKELFKK
ncbi:MAG: hypothetical protein C5B49_11495 [Bdellovibrio sp.]|nr:MAG: hypothetical protein C5B49_11495 [Bdellovibrio sp.]